MGGDGCIMGFILLISSYFCLFLYLKTCILSFFMIKDSLYLHWDYFSLNFVYYWQYI